MPDVDKLFKYVNIKPKLKSRVMKLKKKNNKIKPQQDTENKHSHL